MMLFEILLEHRSLLLHLQFDFVKDLINFFFSGLGWRRERYRNSNFEKVVLQALRGGWSLRRVVPQHVFD